MTPAELVAAFEALAEAPDGVARLQQLILQLAVRGRIAPQYLEDTPARDLLEQVAKERAYLVGEGKILGKQPPPPLKVDEVPFSIPSGWCPVRLIDLGGFVSGKTPSKSSAKYWGGVIPWVSPKDMKREVITSSEDAVTPYAVEDGLTLIPSGSVLLVVRSGILRHTLPVAINAVPCTINQDLKALILCPSVLPSYIRLLLKGFESYILKSLTKVGTTVESVKFREFSEQLFILPPLAEQHRIVARVEELMGLLDRLDASRTKRETIRAAARDSVLAALRQAGSPAEVNAAWTRFAQRMDDLVCDPADIAPLRQTVLQLAVRGHLVRQDATEEPASALLDRIAAEKARLVTAGEASRPKPLLPVTDADYLFTMPPGWMASRFDDVHRKLGAGSTPLGGKRAYVKDGIAFIRSQNVWDDGLRLGDVARITPATHASMKETTVLPNDVLLNITGASIGRSAIAPADIGPANVSQHVAIVRQIEPRMSAWVHLFLISPDGYQSIMGAQVGISREGLSMASLRDFVLPVPPLGEQRRIVARVGELMALLNRLERRLAAARTLHGSFAAAAVHHLET